MTYKTNENSYRYTIDIYSIIIPIIIYKKTCYPVNSLIIRKFFDKSMDPEKDRDVCGRRSDVRL